MKTVKPSKARAFAKELNYTGSCRSGAAPLCSLECPYGLDVRSFVRKLQRGSIRGAYGVLAEQLVFPRTMCAICGSACMAGCEKVLGSEPVRLNALERTVFARSGKNSPPRYRVPQKTERVAVVGGGLCGITCAYVLTTLGYRADLYEKDVQIGGRLREILPEPEYLDEILSVIESENLSVYTGRAVSGIDGLPDYAAIMIATGAGSTALGFAGGTLPDRVFAAGEVMGCTLPLAVESGRKAAMAIDAFLKTGTKDATAVPLALSPKPVERTVDTEPLSGEEAQAEAQNCRLCDCRFCSDVCDLMQYYKTMPEKMESDVRVTLNPVDSFMPRRATRLISSCSDCGLCRDACPESIDMNYVLMTSRALMRDDGSLPAVYHDVWMRDFAFSVSDRAAFLKKPENGYLFFPGCQLGASDPDYAKDAFALLNEARPGSGILLNCCGVPAKWAGETDTFSGHLRFLRDAWEDCGRPVIVTACPTCKKTFRENLPEIPVTSLYEVLAACETGTGGGAGEPVAVFHPCSGRDDPAEQEAVKTLIAACGRTPGEIADPLERNRCCGFGGHIYPANRELFDEMSQRRAASDPLPFVTYCANCRDVLTGKNKDCRHVIELLSGRDRTGTPPPSLNQRRLNRIAVKAFFSGTEPERDGMPLIVTDDLRAAMERDLFGDYDAEAVIRHCLETKTYILTERDTKIGHLKIGTMTFWVEWQELDGAFRIVNAYCHRMTIEGESADER